MSLCEFCSQRPGIAADRWKNQQQPQQTGMPLRHTQHMQPDSMHLVMHSQQAWHISQQALSPLVQVKHTPPLMFVHSHLHMHILHWHIIIPFIMQQQLHMAPGIILHMFCNMAQDISSSHLQVIFMPPAHFSNFSVQLVTMHIPAGEPGIAPGAPIIEGVELPIVPSIPLSIIIVVIRYSFFRLWPIRICDPRNCGRQAAAATAGLWANQSATRTIGESNLPIDGSALDVCGKYSKRIPPRKYSMCKDLIGHQPNHHCLVCPDFHTGRTAYRGLENRCKLICDGSASFSRHLLATVLAAQPARYISAKLRNIGGEKLRKRPPQRVGAATRMPCSSARMGPCSAFSIAAKVRATLRRLARGDHRSNAHSLRLALRSCRS